MNKVLLENYKKFALYDNRRSETVRNRNLVVLQERKTKYKIRMCMSQTSWSKWKEKGHSAIINGHRYNYLSYLDETDVNGSLAEALPTHIEVIFTNDGRRIRCNAWKRNEGNAT